MSFQKIASKLALLTLFSLAAVTPGKAACTSGGIYSPAQAQAGMSLYNDKCASCHNADMSGNSGPALAGPKFLAYLQFTKITASQLESFIAAQMPADAPGSLTDAQYKDIFAYILSYNHYPAGTADMTNDGLSCLNMLPYPGKAQ